MMTGRILLATSSTPHSLLALPTWKCTTSLQNNFSAGLAAHFSEGLFTACEFGNEVLKR